MRRFFRLALAAVLLAALLAGCGHTDEQSVTLTAETATGTLSDERAVAAFLDRIRQGDWDDQKLFDYEDLSAYFVLGEYRGVSYPYDETYLRQSVTDEDVEDYLQLILLNNAVTDDDFTRLSEGAVQKFDVAHIVYEGYMDGVAAEGASSGAEGADLIIGSGSYIDGFEEGLVGKAIGKTATLDLHFSPYYGDDSVAGKDIRFIVTVEYVQRATLPEVTADLINQIFQSSFANMESVRAALKTDMDSDQADRAYRSLSGYVENKVVENSTVKAYPEKEMQHYRDHYVAYIQQYVDQEETTLEAYLAARDMTMEEYRDSMEEYARAAVETDLMIFSIARAENISATDEQISALILGLLEQSEDFSDAQSLIDYYTEIYGPFYFENRIVSAAVAELLTKSAVQED